MVVYNPPVKSVSTHGMKMKLGPVKTLAKMMMDNAAILSPNCVIYGKGTAFRKSYLIRLMKLSNNLVCQSVSPM